EAERHRPASQIVGQAAVRVQLGFLHHVGGVDPGPEIRVQPRLDHAEQARPVPGEEPFEGPSIAGLGLLQQTARLLGVGQNLNHGVPLFFYLREEADLDRRSRRNPENGPRDDFRQVADRYRLKSGTVAFESCSSQIPAAKTVNALTPRLARPTAN